jgi:Kef-type K+ transport system membrane component KefB
MTFGTLALVVVLGIAGPLLALPGRWQLPVVLGELAMGVLFGITGFNRLHAHDPVFTFLANIGFALVMFVAGSHVPVRDPRMRSALRVGALRAVGVGVVAAGAGTLIAVAFGTGHAVLYAVLIASSSAALVLPIVDSLGLSGGDVIEVLPQVAIADAVCIVALPLAIDPAHAARAALGALAVLGCAAVVFVTLRYVEQSGARKRLHQVSEQRRFALELRVSLAILFAVAAVATWTHVSIMLAGFALGIAVAAVGEPRRLAHQLFAISDGFFAPLFFVWLGASLDLRALGHQPSYIAVGVILGVAAVASHMAMRLTGQPLAIGGLAAAQMGVPVAAATLGTELGLLRPAASAALILGALLTVGVAAVCGGLASRTVPTATPPPAVNSTAATPTAEASPVERPS